MQDQNMNKIFTSILSIAMIAILTGCGGAPKSAGNNKWLNFGNGVINLSNVTNISFEDYAIKFDNFTLTLAQVEYTEEEKQQLAKASEANRIAESMHFNAENLKGSGGLDKKTENEVKEFVEKARKLNKKAEEIQKNALDSANEVFEKNKSRVINFIDSSDTYMEL
jgi:hypothetical protein